MRHGTIFVGFSHDQGTLRTMLASMLGADGGPPDKLLAVTRPLSGGYYVIPSADRLAAFEGEIGAMLERGPVANALSRPQQIIGGATDSRAEARRLTDG